MGFHFVTAQVHLPDRFIMSCAILLVCQHWFCLLKYFSYIVYVVALLTLEIWFELEVLANVETLAVRVPWLAPSCLIMLVPHQIWLQGAIYKMIYDALKKEADAGELSFLGCGLCLFLFMRITTT